eukprot:637869-Pelagomonas_calceolata.AAC.7
MGGVIASFTMKARHKKILYQKHSRGMHSMGRTKSTAGACIKGTRPKGTARARKKQGVPRARQGHAFNGSYQKHSDGMHRKKLYQRCNKGRRQRGAAEHAGDVQECARYATMMMCKSMQDMNQYEGQAFE